jgi:hypothetical protein
MPAALMRLRLDNGRHGRNLASGNGVDLETHLNTVPEARRWVEIGR